MTRILVRGGRVLGFTTVAVLERADLITKHQRGRERIVRGRIDAVRDVNRLLDQLEACDIYLTPYFNLQQSTSGTLSYAVALGKAVVSTPYVHARELLAGDAGRQQRRVGAHGGPARPHTHRVRRRRGRQRPDLRPARDAL